MIVLTEHIMSSKRGDLCPQPFWEQAWAEHQEDYQLAYGRAAVKPKGHSSLHLGWQWKRDEEYFDCSNGERQNAGSKNCIAAVDNTRVYEKSSLARMLNAKIRLLSEPNALRDGILPPHAVDADVASHPGVAHCLLGSKMTWFGVPIAVDDFLADVHGEMGLVLACMSLDTELCILLETWEKLHVVTTGAWICRRQGEEWLFTSASGTLS